MRGAKPYLIVSGSSPVREPLDPPDWLSEDAVAEWNRVAPILIDERRTLTVTDIASLVNYCVAIGQAAEASRIITAEGMTYQSKTGPKKHPAVAIRSDAMTQARLLAGELGLTPVSRSRPAARSDTGQGMGPGLFDMEF
ncbi:phage terminase small subunit P27 family [Ancylobacter pratisalsi]|uniref:Phage terminase small subunit P27 family n=1 Tax=Ancylobacter pratisalsi TaxID=1745854 RepID=A0A6P1YKD9_9HYPH|nr:phage terminase small subunit P27 family [Ancylobacter pratisalsi]QIB32683.1 phage terminase small subunit P27 family [Ancylobacter pratisalsi]